MQAITFQRINMRYLLLVISLLVTVVGFSQVSHQVIGSAGESVNTSNVHLDYVIGEVVISPVSAGSTFLDQGFLQNNSLLLSTDEKNDDLNVSIFPIPSTDGVINISTELEVSKIELIDVLGNKEYFEPNDQLTTSLKGVLVLRLWTSSGIVVNKIEVL